MPRDLRIIEETMRDGQLSLWATRMNTEDMLGIGRVVDDGGFCRACVASGAGFNTAVCFLYEDPWERFRLVKAQMPRTPLMILVRSRNLFGWRQFPNDVVDLAMKRIAAVGFEWVLLIDGLNDFANIAYHVESAHRHGLKVDGTVFFAVSPVHTDEYFVAKAGELVALGTDVLTFYDASGVLTPERAAALVPALRAVTGERVPLALNVHDSTGQALACYREGIRLGVDEVATAADTLAHGDSIPSTAETIALADALGARVSVDRSRVARIDDYFDWAATRGGHRRGQKVSYDADAYRRYVTHQIPGGMMSNFTRQLSEAGILERMPLILDEVARVRAEVGYPPMITPYSQMVGVQAVLNVMSGERYINVPRELTLYVSGRYGQLCGPVDPDVYDRVAAGVRPERFDFTTPDAELAALRTARPEMSEDALLLRLFFGQRAFEQYERKRTPADLTLTAMSPLTELIKEVVLRRKTRRLTVRALSRGLSYADVRASAAYLAAAPNAGELAVTHHGLHVAVGR